MLWILMELISESETSKEAASQFALEKDKVMVNSYAMFRIREVVGRRYSSNKVFLKISQIS